MISTKLSLRHYMLAFALVVAATLLLIAIIAVYGRHMPMSASTLQNISNKLASNDPTEVLGALQFVHERPIEPRLRPFIEQLLVDDNPHVRASAASAIGRFRDARSEASLLQMTDDCSPRVVDEVHRALHTVRNRS